MKITKHKRIDFINEDSLIETGIGAGRFSHTGK